MGSKSIEKSVELCEGGRARVSEMEEDLRLRGVEERVTCEPGEIVTAYCSALQGFIMALGKSILTYLLIMTLGVAYIAGQFVAMVRAAG